MSEERNRRPTLAIDFDGVVHRYSGGWQGGTLYDDPMPGAIAGLRTLYGRGYDLVIHTARTDFAAIRRWIAKWDASLFPNSEAFPYSITNVKPPAIAYIDDRAVLFTDWAALLDQFGKPDRDTVQVAQ